MKDTQTNTTSGMKLELLNIYLKKQNREILKIKIAKFFKKLFHK